MANARQVIMEAVNEMHLLIGTTPDDQRDATWYDTRIRPLVALANKAGLSGNGQISDKDVRDSALHPSAIHRLVKS